MMSGIIKTAASAYDIGVDVQQSDGVNGVNIVLAGNQNETSPAPVDQSPKPDDIVVADVMPAGRNKKDSV